MREDTMTLTPDEKQDLFSSIRSLEKSVVEIQATLKIRLHDSPCQTTQTLAVRVDEIKALAADAKRIAEGLKNWKEECEAEERRRHGDWRRGIASIMERLVWAALAAGVAYLKAKGVF